MKINEKIDMYLNEKELPWRNSKDDKRGKIVGFWDDKEKKKKLLMVATKLRNDFIKQVEKEGFFGPVADEILRYVMENDPRH